MNKDQEIERLNLKIVELEKDVEVWKAGYEVADDIIESIPIQNYIATYYGGLQTRFAAAQGVMVQQVTQWVAKDFIVVDHKLYSHRRDLNISKQS